MTAALSQDTAEPFAFHDNLEGNSGRQVLDVGDGKRLDFLNGLWEPVSQAMLRVTHSRSGHSTA